MGYTYELNPSKTVVAATDTAQGVGKTVAELAAALINFMWIECETAGIRYYFDGSTPDTTHGHQLPVATPLKIQGAGKIAAFKFCRDGAVSSVVTMTFDREER